MGKRRIRIIMMMKNQFYSLAFFGDKDHFFFRQVEPAKRYIDSPFLVFVVNYVA